MDSCQKTMKAGTKVRIKGLVNASHHNGKIGSITKASAPEGRIGVKLDDGTVLAVKVANVERIGAGGEDSVTAHQQKTIEPSKPIPTAPKQRTLKRDNALLREFDGSPDPNVLALYYHFADRAFDCFNAVEYNQQMLRYYDNNLSVRLIIPRKIGANEYFLVGLQHAQRDKNVLCEVAFNCKRSFAGISMLVKRHCFACNRPDVPKCKGCGCACFCSDKCRKSDIGSDHERLCKLIQASDVVIEKECVQLL